MSKRAILLIIDSFGIGALPDAHLYGDEGANTALHICQAVGSVSWPHLQKLGLGNCSELLDITLPGCEAVDKPLASYGVMKEASPGKDTTTGHFELAGLALKEPFRTFPLDYPSFPNELTEALQQETGHKIIGNKGASGTVIIEELGRRHLNGEGLIAYTSADSVLQLAAHEDLVPIDELYSICETARNLCDPYNVGRVIARPFIGKPGSFSRTARRRDFSMLPPGETILKRLQSEEVETLGIGKIGDIFSEDGITTSFHGAGNKACLERLFEQLKKRPKSDQFFFVNLVDTDMHYGHRRDARGYHDAVQKIDEALPQIMEILSDNDMLLISADHGCDPTFKGSDHTREFVPILAFCKSAGGSSLGVRDSFCDVAQSLTAYFNVSPMKRGVSFI